MIEGAVNIVSFSSTGREITFAEVGSGETVGELAAIDGQPRSASVVATEDSLLAILPAATFIELLQRNGEVAFNSAVGAGTFLAGFAVDGRIPVLDGILGPVVTNCVVSNPLGRGLFCSNCVMSPVVTGCTFSGNSTGIGGGAGLLSTNSSAIVSLRGKSTLR